MSKGLDKEEPLVSVIVPVHNGSRFVRQSLASALEQTYDNIEVVVVDDGSTDDTRQIVRSIADQDSRVRLLCQSNQGVAAARNRAIRDSEGQFIAPLDADDLWFTRKLERQVQRMTEGELR